MRSLLYSSVFGLACYTMFASLPAFSQESRPTPSRRSFTRQEIVDAASAEAATPPSQSNTESTPSQSPTKKPYPYTPKRRTTTAPSPAAPPIDTPNSYRITAKHREANGIGYEEGYTSLDGFFLFSNIGELYPFFDVRAHVFNNGKPAANFGFGVRYLPHSVHAVFGINGFVDIRSTTHSSFEQVGCGLEILGTKWEMRGNGYFPIFHRTHLYEEAFDHFSGHQAIFQARRDLAFKGLDLSLGRLLLRTKTCDLSSILGGYMFFADYGTRAAGGLLKFKANLTRYLSLEVQGSYDNLFKGIAQGQMALNLPFGKRIKSYNKKLSKTQEIALTRRLAEEVDRFEIIVTHKHTIDYVGKDPRTNQPLNIIVVENTAPSGGDGTFEHPYNTLVDGQNNASSWDMIYVYGGDGSARGMDQGITLQKGQWLQGSSYPFTLTTPFGLCDVPSQTKIRPSIRNPSGDCVTLADNTIVTGFDIRASGSNIAGTRVNTVTISNNNLIVSTAYDIELVDGSGSIIIANNNSLSDQGLFFNSERDTVLWIQNNLFANTGVHNALINILGIANSSLHLQSNTFRGSQEGSSIITSGKSVVSIVIEDSLFSSIQSTALASINLVTTAGSSSTTLFQRNAFNSPTTAVTLTADLLGDATWYVVNNVGHTTTSTSPLYPFTFTSNSIATAKLYLVGNFASNQGYNLINSATSSFSAASLDGTQAGLANLNTGGFSITGTITYIPFDPSFIPIE